MDPLSSLITNAPDWVKRLDELHGQIEQRQLDLAKLQENNPSSSARSIRNRGSTESLKPKDDGAAFPNDDAPNNPDPATPTPRRSTPPQPQQQSGQRDRRYSSSPNSDVKTPSFIQRQTNEVAAAAQRHARAVLRKRPKARTDSMISAEGAAPPMRTRSMIIVYYDSYVQSFFEELVKFVSAQRNLMRKAKMAAKVAEIKRLAELEMPDDESDEENDDILLPGDALIAADPKIAARFPRARGEEELKLRYVSTRLMGPTNRVLNGGYGQTGCPDRGQHVLARAPVGTDQPADMLDQLDRGLEFVQGMCERAAHQFLREGDCDEEIEKIKNRLSSTKQMAEVEKERLDKDKLINPVEPEPMRSRSYRPTTMRRETGSSALSKKKPSLVDDEGFSDI